MVIAPARTGKDSNNKTAVKRTLQTNKGIKSSLRPSPRMFMIVVMKLTEPRMLLIPAICSEKIDISTDGPE